MARKPRVYIGVGHGGSDPGAVGYVVEANVNLKMALALQAYLDANGVDTKISRTTDTENELTNRIREANIWSADLAIDVHNNAGKGDGAEVFYSRVAGTGKVLAQNILDEIVKIGQNSRGIKTKLGSNGLDYFGFIRDTDMPAVIVESAFVDNKADASQIDEAHEQKTFGEAIGKGTLKTLKMMGFNVTDSKPSTSTSGTTQSKPKVVPAKSHDSALKGKYEVTATDGLNLRYEPAVIKDSNLIMTIKHGEKVQNYGYYTSVDGVVWLYVAYGDKVGYVSKAWLRKC